MKPALIGITAALIALPCFAQSEDKKPAPEEPRYYRLDYVVKELEGGKVINSRAYSITQSTQRNNFSTQIRIGDKVPIPTSQSDKEHWTFIDVGVNIDTKALRVVGNDLAMEVTADISSPIAVPSNPGGPPMIRQTRWSSPVVVPIRKATTIFSSDGATEKRQTQLEVTATPIL